MKFCKKCQQSKPISEFYKNKSAKDGLSHYCGDCMKAATAKWKRNDLEKAKRLNRENKRKSKERLGSEHQKEIDRRWYENNKEKKRQQVAEYRAKNKKKIWAQNKVNKAVQYGRLIRPTVCPVCGEKKKVDAHHHDYDKPLDIVWACRSCHMKEHSEYIDTTPNKMLSSN